MDDGNPGQGWIEELRRLLRDLCEYINASPCELSESQPVSLWITHINTVYVSKGCPSPSSGWSELLSELETHLQSPDNDLSPEDNGILDSIIESCGS